jgi:hypothetical protein
MDQAGRPLQTKIAFTDLGRSTGATERGLNVCGQLQLEHLGQRHATQLVFLRQLAMILKSICELPMRCRSSSPAHPVIRAMGARW